MKKTIERKGNSKRDHYSSRQKVTASKNIEIFA
jgi:hypothetical protein